MMTRPVVIFDVDGCLADFMLGFTTLLNREFGTPITRGHQYEQWDEVIGVSPQQVKYGWNCVNQSSTFWLTLDSLVSNEVWDRLRRLQEHTDIYFVTNRSGVD